MLPRHNDGLGLGDEGADALPAGHRHCSLSLSLLPAASRRTDPGLLATRTAAAEGEDGDAEAAAETKPAAKRRAKPVAAAGGAISPDRLPAQLNAHLTGGGGGVEGWCSHPRLACSGTPASLHATASLGGAS